MPDAIKELLHSSKWKSAPTGKPDLFIPFVELGVNLLSKNGRLGYIIPNTFYTSLASKELRRFLQDGRYLRQLVDFDHLQVFQDATIYTCIVIIDQRPKDHFDYVLIEDNKRMHDIRSLKPRNFVKIKFNDIDPSKWSLLNSSDMRNIKKIESAGPKLSSICEIKTGISTMRNHLYVIDDGVLDNGFYEKTYNGRSYLIEAGITREVLKSGQVRDEGYIRSNKKRIIYPYHKNKSNQVCVIPEYKLRKKFPKCYRYLCSIRHELKKRDNGKKRYESWYAYGRAQGLENGHGPKLIMPDMSMSPRFVICKKKNLLFFTGYGLWLVDPMIPNLKILQKILSSKIFAYYMNKTSRRYQNGYRSYAKHFIEDFSIPKFSDGELKFLNKASNVDKMLTKKYGVRI